jgi:hypothetical protein
LFEFSIGSREHPDELAARLRREEADAEHERRKDLLLLWAVLMTVSVVSVVCIVIIAVSGASVDNAKWATTVLTTIISAGVGYMTGKSSKAARCPPGRSPRLRSRRTPQSRPGGAGRCPRRSFRRQGRAGGAGDAKPRAAVHGPRLIPGCSRHGPG